MSCSDELTIWMSSSAMKKPTHITAKAKTLRPGDSSAGCGGHRGQSAAGPVAQVDGGGDREAGPQPAEPRAVAVEQDAHRHPLHDAGEVAGGVLGRE